MTPRQQELLAFIEAEQLAGRTPSYEEMMRALGLHSKSNVARLLDGLEEGGFVRRATEPRARSVVSRRLELAEAARDLVRGARARQGDFSLVPTAELERLRRLLPNPLGLRPADTNRDTQEARHG